LTIKLTPKRRLAGILEPVFAIRTEDDLGIGDTDGVRQMVDWCNTHNIRIFQTLPINETSDANSPYNAISSLAIDPGTIAISPRFISDLAPAAFRKIARPKILKELRKGAVRYPKVRALKKALLQAAFEHFYIAHYRKQTERAGQVREFIMENAAWISDYALFRALMEENGNSPNWERWPVEHLTPHSANSWLLSLEENRRAELSRKQLFFIYVQWIAFAQWRDLKAYAGSKKVFLMGDIPFGVGRQSADVWSNPGVFDLDWSGGAPPERAFKDDPFTVKWGQNWGIPNYRWDELRRQDFSWWRMRVGNIQKTFHLFRIDHALGFFRIYSFPWTPDRNPEFLPLNARQASAKTGGRLPGFRKFPDDTRAHRLANQRQGEELLRFVLEAAGDTKLVAEDLGLVPDYVPISLQKLGIPGFRIPSMFREKNGAYGNPAKFPLLSVTTPATHDHPPLAAVWSDLWRNIENGANPKRSRHELKYFMEFAGLGSEKPPRELTERLHEGYLRRILGSNSWLAILMLTDVFGQSARYNIPGAVSDVNWSLRMEKTVRELDGDPALRAKTEMFARLIAETSRGVS
jgi:4-alpha-glucanotransferase